jgi:hypothetical protein
MLQIAGKSKGSMGNGKRLVERTDGVAVVHVVRLEEIKQAA